MIPRHVNNDRAGSSPRTLCVIAIAVNLCSWCQLDRAVGQATQGGRDGSSQVLEFDVATVKPTPRDNGIWRLQFTEDGFSARGVTLRQVIQEAYGVYEEDRLSQGPQLLTAEDFDIEAKVDTDKATSFAELSLDQRRIMLQRFLADRFRLKVHHESKILPVYSLVVSKKGSKLRMTSAGDSERGEIRGMDGLVRRSGPGVLEVQGISMKGFSGVLSHIVGRLVLDDTGLTGKYDLALQWVPDEMRVSTGDVAGSSPQATFGSDLGDPPILGALEDQVGLKLKPTESSVDTIVIDHVEMPSPN